MIKDFRNFIVHEYFGVDIQIIWDVTKLELPELKDKISQLYKDISNQ
nr:HepT-like ribonuclease domain-containing protein [uncultured Desulfobacter sp.]